MSVRNLKKLGTTVPRGSIDDIDRGILTAIQEDCKTPLTRIGELVGLSAPSVIDRIRKLEEAGVIRGYHAVLAPLRLGLDLMAFVGVAIDSPRNFEAFEREVMEMPSVLECHHVTGVHTMLLKVRTFNTAALEELISRLRSVPGVQRTDTMVVFSTRKERTQIPLTPSEEPDEPAPRQARERPAAEDEVEGIAGAATGVGTQSKQSPAPRGKRGGAR